MNARRPDSEWALPVTEFLSNNLPQLPDGGGWSHMFCSAYQMSCEALTLLGQAEETDWGAIPNPASKLPRKLPRWDDISVVVLRLAEQRDQLGYASPGSGAKLRLAKDAVGFFPEQALSLSITETGRMGPAWAEPEVQSVLIALGLIEDRRWAARAEAVLWREQPKAWRLDIPNDPGFEQALQHALNTLPPKVREEIERLALISDDDIAVAHERYLSAAVTVQGAQRFERSDGPRRTPEQVRDNLAALRQNELDWLFYRRWRLQDGWLNDDEAAIAIEIFHDPLAQQMRRAVVGRLWPQQTEAPE
jgi:hypothetical protein